MPITSSLTTSTKPIDIVKAFMDIYPFNTLYIADLNAIQSIENTASSHRECIDKIHTSFPELSVWIDAGVNNLQKAKTWYSPYTTLILGSESFSSLEQYQLLENSLHTPLCLSLDFTTEGYVGPEELLNNSQNWPGTVIAMTLANVGANNGIDKQTIMSVLSKANNRAIYAAGGIRNIEDLYQLKKLGVKGTLIASALHNKQISQLNLENFFHA